MLKIRDDVDLKELEKYGFEYNEEDSIEEGKWHYWYNDGIYVDVIYEEEPKTERFLSDGGGGYCNDNLDTIYDLIKDDLVEKVKE